MNPLCLSILLLLSITTIAQDSSSKYFKTRQEAETAIQSGQYKTSIGWMLKEGEEIKLASGSMPDKTFAFITEMPNLLTYNSYTDYNKAKLPHTYTGRTAVIKSFEIIGTKKTGFYIVVRIKVGLPSRYIIDIENAIESKEIVVPSEYVKKEPIKVNGKSGTVSIADEIKKLKELLDAGAISKEEFEVAKKKLLEN